MGAPEDHHSGSGPRGSPGKAETLRYLCDIIHELKNLADRAEQRTLSAILAAALTEARIQNDNRER